MDSSRYSDDSCTTVEDQNTEENAVEGVNKQVCADQEARNYWSLTVRKAIRTRIPEPRS